jgi:excisionase family DNA binding protein
MNNTRLLIGIKEASRALGISHWTLGEYIRTGKLGHVRIGRRVLVEPAELERFVAEGRRGGGR